MSMEKRLEDRLRRLLNPLGFTANLTWDHSYIRVDDVMGINPQHWPVGLCDSVKSEHGVGRYVAVPVIRFVRWGP